MKVTDELEALRAAKPHLFGLAPDDGLHFVGLEKARVRAAYDAEVRALQQLMQSYRAARRWESKSNPTTPATPTGERILNVDDMSGAEFNRLLKSMRDR